MKTQKTAVNIQKNHGVEKYKTLACHYRVLGLGDLNHHHHHHPVLIQLKKQENTLEHPKPCAKVRHEAMWSMVKQQHSILHISSHAKLPPIPTMHLVRVSTLMLL